MKLSDQVCTREQAQRLKELGVDGDSLFAWEQSGLPGEWRVTYPSEYARETKTLYPAEIKWIPAWTAGELSMALGNYYLSWQFPVPGQNKNLWIATVICGPKPEGIDNIHTAHEFDRTGETQAEALAILLIAVLTTGAEKVEDVNKRLKQ